MIYLIYFNHPELDLCGVTTSAQKAELMRRQVSNAEREARILTCEDGKFLDYYQENHTENPTLYWDFNLNMDLSEEDCHGPYWDERGKEEKVRSYNMNFYVYNIAASTHDVAYARARDLAREKRIEVVNKLELLIKTKEENKNEDN